MVADAMQSRLGRDPDDGVGRAERRDSCGQHDPGDDDQHDAARRARANNQRHHDGGRRDDEGPKSAVERPHVAGHRDLLSQLRYARYKASHSTAHANIGVYHGSHSVVLRKACAKAETPAARMRASASTRTASGRYRRSVRGRPLRLRFRRDESSRCSETVLLPELGRFADLPEGETVTIEATRSTPATMTFRVRAARSMAGWWSGERDA